MGANWCDGAAQVEQVALTHGVNVFFGRTPKKSAGTQVEMRLRPRSSEREGAPG